MDLIEAILSRRVPPVKLKVYAPNGDTKEITGRVGLRISQQHDQLVELFLLHEDGTTEALNKKVVVKNLETGVVCYNPRTMPRYFNKRVIISKSEILWLQKNPHWPAVLELQDNPVTKGAKK